MGAVDVAAMIFINPKTDFAFKKIFGSEQSHDILISFLNGILYDGEPVIADLEILNPYQAPLVMQKSPTTALQSTLQTVFKYGKGPWVQDGIGQ
jgi:hypothetical protein